MNTVKSLLAAALLAAASCNAYVIAPDYKVNPLWFDQLIAVIGDADATQEAPWTLAFARGEITLGETLYLDLRDVFANAGSISFSATQAQLDALVETQLNADFAGFTAVFDAVMAQNGYTEIIRSPNVGGSPTYRNPNTGDIFDYTWSQDDINTVYEVASLLAMLNSLETQTTPGASLLRPTSDAMVRGLFTKARTSRQKTAEKDATAPRGILGQPTRFTTDAYYGRSEFSGGTTLTSYGVNLGAVIGEELKFRATVPVARNELGGVDSTTTGLDLLVVWTSPEGWAFGAHANYLWHFSDGGDFGSWTLGPNLGYTVNLSDSWVLSGAALVDRIESDDAEGIWLSSVGLNVGYLVTPDIAVNAYTVANRLFEGATVGDRDWFDVGLECAMTVGDNWSFNAGVRTLVDYAPVDSSYELYLGSMWRF